MVHFWYCWKVLKQGGVHGAHFTHLEQMGAKVIEFKVIFVIEN
jgi:hypothetical protein